MNTIAEIHQSIAQKCGVQLSPTPTKQQLIQLSNILGTNNRLSDDEQFLVDLAQDRSLSSVELSNRLELHSGRKLAPKSMAAMLSSLRKRGEQIPPRFRKAGSAGHGEIFSEVLRQYNADPSQSNAAIATAVNEALGSNTTAKSVGSNLSKARKLGHKLASRRCEACGK